MKAAFLFIAIAFGLAVTLLSGCSTQPSIVGHWKTKDAQGHDSSLFLSSDGKIEAISQGERLSGTWSITADTNPQEITFIFEARTVRSIVKLEGDILKIERASDDGKIPAHFNPDQTITYRREPK